MEIDDLEHVQGYEKKGTRKDNRFFSIWDVLWPGFTPSLHYIKDINEKQQFKNHYDI